MGYDTVSCGHKKAFGWKMKKIKRPKKIKKYRNIKILLIFAILVLFSFVAWMTDYATTPLNLMASAQEVSIQSGSGLRSVALQLKEQGVISNEWPFILLAKALHKESNLQAGEYHLNKNISPYYLLVSLIQGKTTQSSITFIEGKTFNQMQQSIAANDALKHTALNLSDVELMRKLGSDISHPEGLFFPDTYYFNRNVEDVTVLKRAYDTMQTKLESAWQARADNLPYKNSYEALIMASIIEKETGQASERKMIAGVFVNRLRIGMRLQTDPTVIYGMGEQYQGNIRRKDLLNDTAYNTYTRSGLPPTPIAMPSLASIEAALHPEDTRALYFVGKGDGRHVFSSSLAEHNRAVTQYQLKK
jgi:UPF0755 protein